jgi:hypothetical protein
MPKTLDTESAKRYAIELLSGTSLGDWKSEGISLTTQAAAALREIGLSTTAEPVNKGRLAPSGNPLDLYAESPWHALCAMLFQETISRFKRGSYAPAVADLYTAFGGRPFYRGQARAWDIQPSAWRSPEQAQRSSGAVRNFASAMRDHLEKVPDPVMLTVGRKDETDEDFSGLAQHYRLPTNLVDFTLNPLVAIGFACGDDDSPPLLPRDLLDPRLIDCAIVYAIAAPAFATAGSPAFEFPPSYSLRLYRQQGLFADYGPYPGEDAVSFPANYEASWCWLQQNCQRIFFPRTYPVAKNIDELRDHDLMKGDEFLIQIAERVRVGLPAGAGDIETAPPWSVDTDNMTELGRVHAEMASRIDTYLRRACLLKMEDDGDVFDPVMVGLLRRWVEPEFNFLLNMATFTEHPGLVWSAAQIEKALTSLVDANG